MSPGECYGVLLIDLDGTVVDYARTEAAALTAVHAEFFAGHVLYPDFAAAFHACNDWLWEAYRQGRLDLDDLRVERFARLQRQWRGTRAGGRRGGRGAGAALPAVVARFEAELGRCVALFPEARSALRSLRRLARLVLVTDGVAAVQHAKLSRTRLRRFFERIVISSEVGYRKPQPALLHRALDLPGADPSTALVVGDSAASDGAGAHAAGLDFCWVNRTGPRPPASPSAFTGRQAPARFQVRDLRAVVDVLTPQHLQARLRPLPARPGAARE